LRSRLAFPIVALVLIMAVLPAHAMTKVGKNIDITASNDPAERQQVEPTIAVDPRNPNIIVAGAQDYRLLSVGGHRWHGFYRSTDDGLTWTVSLVPGFPGDNSSQGLSSPLHAFQCTSDPVLTFDLNGNVYYTGITCSTPGFTLFVVKYTGDGATYAGTTIFPISTYHHADKPWIAVDTSGGQNDGNVYLTYDDVFAQGPQGATLVSSRDGGQTWSLPMAINPGGFDTGITVDMNGRVFVSSLSSGFPHASMFMSISIDAGRTFTTHRIFDVTELPRSLPGNSFRTFTIPQLASDSNGVYVVWDDYELGNSNVMFARSTDGGNTWTTPTPVNDVITGQHFFSSIAASGGVISIVWYDSRFGQLSNGTITGLNVFYAQSTNAGTSFSKNMRVTSASFNPNLVERADFGNTQPFMGDYIQVAASQGAAHPIWADNRDACSNTVPIFGCTNQDLFTATITF